MITSLRDAFSFLTVLPFSCPLVSDRPADRMSRALAWFPLTGAFIGAVAGSAAWLVWHEWSQAVGAWVAVGVLAVLTGTLHLDGFADTMDGFGARKDRERTLEIMKDSHIGTMGSVALILLLGLQWSLIREFTPGSWIRVLVTAGALSRLAMVISAHSFSYVPGKTGIGRVVTDRKEPLSLAIAGVTGLAAAVWAFGFPQGVLVTLIAAGSAWLLNLWIVSRLGGVTGDTIGAVNELVGLMVLLTLSVSA